MKRMTALIVALGLAAGTAGASAGSGLRSEADINNGLLVLAVADKIRNDCTSISARFFRANGYVNGLRSLAKSRGYSRAEIDAYTRDPIEKARMFELRDAWIKDRGASDTDPTSLCALGIAEIVQGSTIGRLLKAK